MDPSPRYYIPSFMKIERPWRVFTMYGHGGHLSHVTWRWPHEKITFVPPSHGGSIWNLTSIGPAVSETFENVNDRQQTNQSCHPISSPMSLWLRGAKKEKILKAYLCDRSRPHPDGFYHFTLNCLKNGLQLCFLPGIAISNVVERHLLNCPTT